MQHEGRSTTVCCIDRGFAAARAERLCLSDLSQPGLEAAPPNPETGGTASNFLRATGKAEPFRTGGRQSR